MQAHLNAALHSCRLGVLWLLLAVLPLQSVVQLVSGLQSPRHVHTGAPGAVEPARPAAESSAAVRLALAALQPALRALARPATSGWTSHATGREAAHAHGGVWHSHTMGGQDIVSIADAAEEMGVFSGAVVFLAWLPQPLPLLAAAGSGLHDALIPARWNDYVHPPRFIPPR